MHHTVKMPRTLLDLLAHVIVDFHVEDIGHDVERILVVFDLRIKAGQVEAVGKVFFVDFAKIFVPAGGDELRIRLR